MDVAEYLNIHVDDDLLSRAWRGRICPVCLVVQTKTYELLCRLQAEAVWDETVNALILSVGGYCHFHFWYLEKLARPVTNARLMERLLDGVSGRLFGDGSQPAENCSVLRRDCPVCHCCERWEQSFLSDFADRIGGKDFAAEFQNSAGLCLPHLSEALRTITDLDARALVIESSRHQLNHLIGELRRLIAKAENLDRARGTEDDSNYRAIAKLVGGRFAAICDRAGRDPMPAGGGVRDGRGNG